MTEPPAPPGPAGGDQPTKLAPPRHLSAEARELWRTLHEAFVLDSHEEKTLRLALEALDRANQARRALRRHGLVYEDRFGAPHARPEVAIERDSRQAWIRMMAALDLPAEEAPGQSRARHGQFGPRTPRGRDRAPLEAC
jgi:phage terminase small subunit